MYEYSYGRIVASRGCMIMAGGEREGSLAGDIRSSLILILTMRMYICIHIYIYTYIRIYIYTFIHI